MGILELWREWNIRFFILLSLFIQFILIFLGCCRKNSTSKLLNFVVWIIYLLANWLADFTLSFLSRSMDYSSPSNAIVAFWAPFLILHLGGPDTITAYSMEDNELWSRHLLALGYEFDVAFYVISCTLPNIHLITPTLLILLVAIIKYLERTYSFYKASIAGFRSSIGSFVGKQQKNISSVIPKTEDFNSMIEGFHLYSACKHFFVDVMPELSAYVVRDKLVQDMTAKEALRAIGMELNYAYDEFYTKAAINHSKVGYVLRALCSICTLLAFLLYILAPKESFNKHDVAITYVLLAVSIFLDITAVIMLLFSNWMLVSIFNIKKLGHWTKSLAECVARIKIFFLKEMYWSGEMPQLNLFSDCLEIFASNNALQQSMINWIKVKLTLVQEIDLYPSWNSSFVTYNLRTLQPVHATQEIQELIVANAQKCLCISEGKLNKPAGHCALEQVQNIPIWVVPSFDKLMEGLSLDHQVLVWHITTELCFHWKESYHPLSNNQTEFKVKNNSKSLEEACKYLSNYMMYMVLMQPEIMSTMEGASPSVFWKTYNDMVQFINRRVDDDKLSKKNATIEMVCREMLRAPIELTTFSSLFKMALVLSYLMLIVDREIRWQVMITVWVELMIQGVINTRANMIVKQLSRGAELFTLIWLLTKHVRMENTSIIEGNMSHEAVEIAIELLSMIKNHVNCSSGTDIFNKVVHDRLQLWRINRIHCDGSWSFDDAKLIWEQACKILAHRWLTSEDGNSEANERVFKILMGPEHLGRVQTQEVSFTPNQYFNNSTTSIGESSNNAIAQMSRI